MNQDAVGTSFISIARSAVGHVGFAALPLVLIVSAVSIIAGGAWTWLGGATILILTLALDEIGGDYRNGVESASPAFLNAMLYVTVPLTGIMTLALLIQTASPDYLLSELLARNGVGIPNWLGTLGAVLTVGVVGGWASGAFGHELMHRSTRFEGLLAQFMLAHCLYAPLTIEHVFGHHKNVGLETDVATVPRGVSFWRYLPRGIRGVYMGAAAIEARRMRRRGLPVTSIRNRFMQGILIEMAFLLVVFLLAGPSGLAAFVASAAISILVIELANYIGHYGLVRVPGRPVRPRHSWNAARYLSSNTTVNLPRHSHHHRSAGTPYWELVILDDAPIYPVGSAIVTATALLPRLFFAMVNPLLDDWDARLASDEERAMLRERRKAAGIAWPDRDSDVDVASHGR